MENTRLRTDSMYRFPLLTAIQQQGLGSQFINSGSEHDDKLIGDKSKYHVRECKATVMVKHRTRGASRFSPELFMSIAKLFPFCDLNSVNKRRLLLASMVAAWITGEVARCELYLQSGPLTQLLNGMCSKSEDPYNLHEN